MPSKPFLAITHLSPPSSTLYGVQVNSKEKIFFFALDILNKFFNQSLKAMISPCWAWHKKVQGKVLLWSIFCGVTLLPLPPHAISPLLKRHTGAPDRSKSHTPYYANSAQCAKSLTPLWHTHIYSAWSWDLLCQLKLICHTLLTPLYPTIYEVILHTLTEANIPLSARKWAIFCRFILLTMAWDEITYIRPFREILVYIENSIY